MTSERRCSRCERPIVRVGPQGYGKGEWVHRALSPESHDFYYCELRPGVVLSEQPHAEPQVHNANEEPANER